MSWYEQGFAEGKELKPIVPPTKRKRMSMEEHIAANLILPGVGLLISMWGAESSGTVEDDQEYMRGYNDGLTYRARLDEVERKRRMLLDAA